MQVQSLGWEIPWSRKQQPTPAFLPEEFDRQSSLASYSQWYCKEAGMTEHNTVQRTIARDYSEEVGLEVSIYVILAKEQCMQSNTYFGRRLLLVTRIRCLS